MRLFNWLPRRKSSSLLIAKTVDRPLGGSYSSDDCAAFLLGRLAEYRIEHGERASTWEWTNLLAHGSEDDLQGELEGSPCQSVFGRVDPADGWRAARSYLAAELLSLTGSAHDLSSLQSAVLVPLELDLAGDPSAVGWGPDQWVVVVESALRQYRRANQESGRRTRGPHEAA